jgi:hypothetical protein
MLIGAVQGNGIAEFVAKAQTDLIAILVGQADGAEAIGDWGLIPTQSASQRPDIVYTIDPADRDQPAIPVLFVRHEGWICAFDDDPFEHAPLRELDLPGKAEIRGHILRDAEPAIGGQMRVGSSGPADQAQERACTGEIQSALDPVVHPRAIGQADARVARKLHERAEVEPKGPIVRLETV